MKFNKWTVGLAAIGVVSLASAVRADETKMSQVQTALSNTTLSGYVDTSIQWNPSGGAFVAPVAFQNTPQGIVGSSTATSSKANNFNLNVIDIALDKPEDEGPWASGYHVELWFGQDATTLGTSGQNSILNNNGGGALGNDVAIRQAYITLRTPVGNGIDWKLGVFDTIIGYESTSSPLNPNYTHSYGYTMEPTTHTGLTATYKFCDALSATAGIADSKGPVMNDQSTHTVGGASDSFKTYMGAVTLTAPQSMGWASGATLSAGVVSGDYSDTTSPFGKSDATTSWYVGGTLPTPNSNLKLGASFDYETAYGSGNPWALAGYVNFQASPKLSLNGRIEWAKNYLSTIASIPTGVVLPSEQNAVALTATVQYDLWANVLTRLEFRWDHASHDIYGGNLNGPTDTQSYGENAIMVALQAVYKF
ncbi:MAG: outer membrane beta-barrel protein [Limisphaerales bacterium]